MCSCGEGKIQRIEKGIFIKSGFQVLGVTVGYISVKRDFRNANGFVGTGNSEITVGKSYIVFRRLQRMGGDFLSFAMSFSQALATPPTAREREPYK